MDVESCVSVETGVGYGFRTEDFLPAAGLSTFRRVNHAHTKAQFTKGEDADLSLLKGHEKYRGKLTPRLNPAAFEVPAGGVPKADRLECNRVKIAAAKHERTDPITHFRHEGVVYADAHPEKRFGYEQSSGKQTWTWAQEPTVVAERGLGDLPKSLNTKHQLGADGNRYYNVCGCEDLLPAATKDYVKSDKQPRQELIDKRDKEQLAYCLRERFQNRPEHTYWKSDRVWKALRRDDYNYEMQRQGTDVGKPTVRWPELRTRTPETQTTEWVSDTEDDFYERSDHSRNAKYNEMVFSSRNPEKRAIADSVANQKGVPWMSLENSLPTSVPSDQGPALSMTSRSVARNSRTSRSLTPRSSVIISGSVASSARDLRLRSTEEGRLQNAVQQHETSSRAKSARPEEATIKPQREAPRSRNSLNSSTGSLSMMPQMVSRRAGGSTPLSMTPRSLTPRGSTPRSLRKSASEVAIR